MYLLIIAIHTAFFLTSHLLGYRVLEVIFLILGIFFLFYFSPLFFMDEEKSEKKSFFSFSPKEIFRELSPKNSLLIPITLLYIALYGFIFSVFGKSHDIFPLHTILILGIYMLLVGYCLVFYWKHDIFFEIFRFHTLFTLVSTIIFTLSFFFTGGESTLLYPIVGCAGILGSLFLLQYTKKENNIFLASFLLTIFSVLSLTLLTFFPHISIPVLIFLGVIFSGIIFEIFPRFSIFASSTEFFQYFSLTLILLLTPGIVYLIYTTLDSLLIFLLVGISLFFVSIHIRFTNYITFITSILSIYFIYAIIFSDLIVSPSMISLFLFVFFLPILIIGTTYFWEEQHAYDFSILHSISIAFSIVWSIYSIFFLVWGGDLLFITSLCIFGIALLFFLSYFQFRTEKLLPH